MLLGNDSFHNIKPKAEVSMTEGRWLNNNEKCPTPSCNILPAIESLIETNFGLCM